MNMSLITAILCFLAALPGKSYLANLLFTFYGVDVKRSHQGGGAFTAVPFVVAEV